MALDRVALQLEAQSGSRGFLSGLDGTADVPLMAGDIVFVPRTRIAEVALWVDQAINRTIPFSRNFSYAINRNMPGNFF